YQARRALVRLGMAVGPGRRLDPSALGPGGGRARKFLCYLHDLRASVPFDCPTQPKRTSSYWTNSTGGFGINDPLARPPAFSDNVVHSDISFDTPAGPGRKDEAPMASPPAGHRVDQ